MFLVYAKLFQMHFNCGVSGKKAMRSSRILRDSSFVVSVGVQVNDVLERAVGGR